MTSQQILDICLLKPGAHVTFPFGADSFVVKLKSPSSQARIFAQLFLLRGEPYATFNCDAATGLYYRALYPESVTRGYHCPPVQQPYFNTVKLDGSVPDDVLANMIEHAYHTVLHKLPKYARRELIGQA